MKVIKFLEFIKESVHDTPEEYVNTALMKIKSKVELMFKDTSTKEEDKKFITMSDALKNGKEKESKKDKITFSELGLSLVSSELSKYSSLFDSVKFIFEDNESRYDLYVTISLKDAVPSDDTKDFSDQDIKKCFIKFKRYNKETLELSPIINKNVDISSIDEDFIIGLKVQLDEENGDTEKLEIETE